MTQGLIVSAHILKMIGHLNRLERLRHPFLQELTIDIILALLSKENKQLVLNYNINNTKRNIVELHQMLKDTEKSVEPFKTKDVLMIREGRTEKKWMFRADKGKKMKNGDFISKKATQPKDSKTDQQCFPDNLRDKTNGVGTSSS